MFGAVEERNTKVIVIGVMPMNSSERVFRRSENVSSALFAGVVLNRYDTAIVYNFLNYGALL